MRAILCQQLQVKLQVSSVPTDRVQAERASYLHTRIDSDQAA